MIDFSDRYKSEMVHDHMLSMEDIFDQLSSMNAEWTKIHNMNKPMQLFEEERKDPYLFPDNI